MKRHLLSILFLLMTNICLADQLAYILLNQAIEAEAYLKKTDHVILWCTCCVNDPPELIIIDHVYYMKVNYKDYYQVVIQGRNEKNEFVSKEVDLAYVYSLENGFYKAVGKILEYECDPCTDPFQISIDDSESKNKFDHSTMFIISGASTNGVDTTPSVLKTQAYIGFYWLDEVDVNNNVHMAYVWPKNNHQSYGQMILRKTSEAETYEEYKAAYLYYDWLHVNNFNYERGTTKVQVIKVFKPKSQGGISYVLKIIPENSDVTIYEGYFEGNQDFPNY